MHLGNIIQSTSEIKRYKLKLRMEKCLIGQSEYELKGYQTSLLFRK